MYRARIAAIILAPVMAFATLPRLTAQSAAINPALFSGLKWRMVGPFRAGRVNAITGVIGQPNTFYFGAVGGGLWKSTNIGRTWTPIFDANDVASIGAIAMPMRPSPSIGSPLVSCDQVVPPSRDLRARCPGRWRACR